MHPSEAAGASRSAPAVPPIVVPPNHNHNYTKLYEISALRQSPKRVALNDVNIVTCCDDSIARVYRLSDGVEVARLDGHAPRAKITSVDINSRFIITGADDKTAILWESSGHDSYAIKKVLGGREGDLPVTAVRLLSTLVFVANEGGLVKVYRPSGSIRVNLNAHKGARINCLDVRGKHLVTGGEDKYATLWSNVTLGQQDEDSASWKNDNGLMHDCNVLAVSFNECETLLATGTVAHQVRVWCVKDGKMLALYGRGGNKNVLRGTSFVGWHKDTLLANGLHSSIDFYEAAKFLKPRLPLTAAVRSLTGKAKAAGLAPRRDIQQSLQQVAVQALKQLQCDENFSLPGRNSAPKACWRHYVVSVSRTDTKGEASLTVWCTEPGKRRMQSQSLGVSLKFLLESFTNFVEEITEEPDPTFRDLSEMLWTGEEAIHFRTSKDEICPRDDRPGCSIVDVLSHTRESGKASYFMSWSWSYTVSMMVSALQRWQEKGGQSLDTTFIWICFFVNNQYRILVEKQEFDSQDLGDIFASRLKNCGQVLVLLDTYKHPLYVTRVWCVFETFQATKNDVPLEVILPQTALMELEEDLSTGQIHVIKEAIGDVRVENATAWSKEDEENIKREIEMTTGYDRVNQAVKDFLVTWIAGSFHNILQGTTVVLEGMPTSNFDSPRVHGARSVAWSTNHEGDDLDDNTDVERMAKEIGMLKRALQDAQKLAAEQDETIAEKDEELNCLVEQLDEAQAQIKAQSEEMQRMRAAGSKKRGSNNSNNKVGPTRSVPRSINASRGLVLGQDRLRPTSSEGTQMSGKVNSR